MKTSTLSLLFIISVLVAAAQKKDSSLLKQFKFRSPSYIIASVSGNAYGDLSANKQYGAQYHLALNPRLSISKLVSTEQLYSVFYSDAAFSLSNSRANYVTGKRVVTDLSYSVSQSLQNKYYREKRYFLISYNGTLSQHFFKSNNDYYTKSNNIGSTIIYTMGIGKGRIENVTDAQMALYILNDLQKNALLTRGFTTDDAYELAKTITRVNNTRLFDSRRKRIYELKQLDSLFKNRGLVNERSIEYFTTVTDNWFYAMNPQRKNGTDRYASISPIISNDETRNRFYQPADSSQKLLNRSLGAFLTLGIEKASALSLKKQFNRGISLVTQYTYTKSKNKYNNKEIVDVTKNSYSALNGFLEFGYYPNSRTNISVNLVNNLAWVYSSNTLVNNMSVGFDGNYFITYKTRVFVVAGLHAAASSRKFSDNANLNTSFNVGLQHFIR
ncbi:MAG: hypothetical protein U0V75_14930 [Ferruginibacter sp.]